MDKQNLVQNVLLICFYKFQDRPLENLFSSNFSEEEQIVLIVNTMV